MMTFGELQTEPAFISHERFAAKSRRQQGLADCCYSVSNLAVIIACIVALIFSVNFIYDDPLYDYGEHILSVRFYRQIIFIIVILPLTLLVPLFNAASAFFLSGRTKVEIGSSLVIVKLIYSMSMALLALIGLVFVAPSIRFSSVASQIDYELRRHMSLRYDNQFSYEFLDQIQEKYECCDEPWWRLNYPTRIPLTCYVPDGAYTTFYNRNCAEVIGTLVSNRCMIIAACLLTILVALGTLIMIDIFEMVALSSRQYNIGSREARRAAAAAQTAAETASLNPRRPGDGGGGGADDDDALVDEISNRLRLAERERERPLLPKTRSQQSLDNADDHNNNNNERHSQQQTTPTADPYNVKRLTPLMTRTSYLNNRPQSPVLMTTSNGTTATTAPGGSQGSPSPTATRSVLKKTSSFQRLDESEEEQEDEDLQEYHRQVQRGLQTRRSMLNVRFAE